MNKFEKGFNKTKKALTSTTAKVAGMTAIAFALNMGTASAQTLMNKKDVKQVYEIVKKSQENIGENMAKFIFGGEIEKWLQDEIVKQNNEHRKDKEEFSLFKNEEVKEMNTESDLILSKKEMEAILLRKLDSMVTLDVAEYYKSFQSFQASNINIAGDRKKGKLPAWFNLLEHKTMVSADYLENNKKLPYTKEELEKAKQTFDSIYTKHLTAWQTKALANRQSMSPAEYESANLLALEEAREAIVKALNDKYGKPIIEKVFKQFYATETATKGTQKKK